MGGEPGRAGLRGILERVSTNVYIFLAGILVSNGVNLFNYVYGSDTMPKRSLALTVSSVSSIIAGAFWTMLAAKVDQYLKTVDLIPYTRIDRDVACAEHWLEVRGRIIVLVLAACSASAVGVVVLLLPMTS